MRKTILTILAVLTSLAASGAALYYYHVRAAAPPASGVVVRDRSESVASNCDCTAGIAREAFKDRNLTRGSKLSVIATGDRATADEPVSIARYDAPSTRQAIEGRNQTQRKQGELLQDLQQKCQQLSMTKRSPIVLAIRRAIDGLRAEGCKPSAGCFVYVQSDGQENSEAKIRQLLAGNTNTASPRSLVNNDGIDVVFYGFSETKGEETLAPNPSRQITKTRDAVRADRLEALWRSLFTHPERLSFRPFCPKTTVVSR